MCLNFTKTILSQHKNKNSTLKKYNIGLLIFLYASLCNASAFYVSSTAAATGNGSFENPWQLQTAFNHPKSLLPGDTVWIREGVYTNSINAPGLGMVSFMCNTKGTAPLPIIFRNYNNERVTIDANENYAALCFMPEACSYTWIWGIEVMSSSTKDRGYTPQGPASVSRGNIYCNAPGIKFVNMVIHDLGDGLELWSNAIDNESYGNIIYNTGNDESTGGHGHGIYGQNGDEGTKKIHNNIFFSSYGFNVRLWSTNQSVNNFDIRNNILFNGGSSSQVESRKHNFFIVSNNPKSPIRNLLMKHNYTYSGITTTTGSCNTIGANYGSVNMRLDSNYFSGQLRLAGPFTDFSANGNFVFGGTDLPYIRVDPALAADNSFRDQWANSTFQENEPTEGLDYFVIPNKYEPGMANIAVYNWGNAETVEVDISDAGLQPGDKYELVNVMDYYNDIITGEYTVAGTIEVPMTGHTFAQAIGSSKPPVSQFPKFGVFVLRKKN